MGSYSAGTGGEHVRIDTIEFCRILVERVHGDGILHHPFRSKSTARIDKGDNVGFFDCKVDGANFRMTKWKAAEFQNCDLVDADFYGSTLPGSRFENCDLSGVQLSKADLSGTRLHGSTLERIQGSDSLRGVIIGSDQVIPVALAVFGTLNIVVDDELP